MDNERLPKRNVGLWLSVKHKKNQFFSKEFSNKVCMLLTSADELHFPLQNAKLLKLNISLFFGICKIHVDKIQSFRKGVAIETQNSLKEQSVIS